jgi:predicted nucleic acid-binding protein
VTARDAIHIATMQEHGVTRIMSFDRGFDQIAHLTRVSS